MTDNPDAQDKPRLSLRRFDQFEAGPIPGTEDGSSPFLSPDEAWIGYWADGKLMKVPVEGGIAAPLCDVPVPFGFSWGTDNHIILAADFGTELSRVSATGGKTETLTAPDQSKGEYGHCLPCCLPGGKGILFTVQRRINDPQPRVAVLGLPTREWRVLFENAADTRYLTSGHLTKAFPALAKIWVQEF